MTRTTKLLYCNLKNVNRETKKFLVTRNIKL
jgi:hypothetical protein